jgi:pyruvate ferredoxin oxidoreductase gamma subunit
LAVKHIKRPLPNAALLGGFAAVSGELTMESVASAVMTKFPGAVGEANVAAAREAFEMVLAK